MRLVREEQMGHRVPESAVGALCAELFAPLPRSDQRRKGELYVRGLLSAGGRKSIRNIAACVGDRAAEQSLHHFISSSTWDWGLVREALALRLERSLRPRAWVAQSVVIPKAGQHTVGVERRFVPSLGQVVNSQQVFGIWAANDELSAPVNWRLMLSGQDVREAADGHEELVSGRAGAGLPVTPLECVAGAALEAQSWVGGRPRPVVMDLPDSEPAAVARRFEAARLPFLASVHGSTRVLPAASALPGSGRAAAAVPVLPGHDSRELSADQLLRMLRTLRRPVTWTDPGTMAVRTSLVAAVPVRLPGTRRPLLLLGEWTGPGVRPQQCWITDLSTVPWGGLLRLAKLTQRVGRDFAGISTQVGMVDFEGRSFEGWHRHTTLASGAHAVQALSGVQRRTAARTLPGARTASARVGAPALAGVCAAQPEARPA
ncbi:transposase [Streptomyces venezuelae]|uniref:IS701 family transposase n=1 Tax=Streptomyces venezuelae TaxID=54571 RepID=UPI001CC25745|nr:transposase [Streptomyces venezuelae]